MNVKKVPIAMERLGFKTSQEEVIWFLGPRINMEENPF